MKNFSTLCSTLSVECLSRGLDFATVKNNLGVSVRSLVSSEDICKGSSLVVVPQSSCLNANGACSIIQATMHRDLLPAISRLARQVPSFLPCCGRWSLLVATSLCSLHMQTAPLSNNHSLSMKTWHWAHSMPRKTPPVSEIVKNAAEDSLKPQAVLEAARRSLFENRSLSLRERDNQQKSRAKEQDTVQRIAELQCSLKEQVLEPLAAIIVHHFPKFYCNAPTAMRDHEAVLDALLWSHSMVRSRSVNIDWNERVRVTPAIIPVVDLLNHSTKNFNVTFSPNHLRGTITLLAVKDISRGDSLCLDYGDYWQRGSILFPPAVTEETHESVVNSLEKIALAQYSTKKKNRELESLASTSWSEKLSIKAKKGELMSDADWLWNYGFMKSSSEKVAEASCLWDDNFRQRIKNMCDRRRKGRPGEFVVGVPEGLSHLQFARERLQKERYGGKNVFPLPVN